MQPQPTLQHFIVTDAGGAYTTQRVRGETASSTSSHLEAANRLAVKLFGPSLLGFELTDEPVDRRYVYIATADPQAVAYCDIRSGELAIHSAAPDGNFVQVATGPTRALMLKLDVDSHRPPDLTFRVPGFIASATEETRLLCINAWLTARSRWNNKRGCLSVTYASCVVRAPA